MKRFTLRAGALSGLVGLALFSSACNLQWSPYAAKVGGQEISTGQLDSALKRASHDAAFKCLLESSATSGYRLEGTGSDTYDSAFVAFILTDLVDSRVASRVVQTDHLRTGAAAYSLARSQVSEALQSQASQANCPAAGQKALAGLGPSLSSSFVRLQLDEDALAARAAGVRLNAAGIRRFETSHPALTRESCISGIFVQTKAKANSIEQAVTGGESFASLISKYAKTSTSSAGALGCYTGGQLGQISPAIAQAVASGRVGQVLKPVYYQSTESAAYVVAEVTSRPYEPAAAALNQLFSSESAAFERAIVSGLGHLQVSIDPRYGRWSATKAGKSASAGFGGRVVPPKGPALSLVLNRSTIRGKANKAGSVSGLGNG